MTIDDVRKELIKAVVDGTAVELVVAENPAAFRTISAFGRVESFKFFDRGIVGVTVYFHGTGEATFQVEQLESITAKADWRNWL